MLIIVRSLLLMLKRMCLIESVHGNIYDKNQYLFEFLQRFEGLYTSESEDEGTTVRRCGI